MNTFTKFIITTLCFGFLLTSPATLVFANSTLVSEMAALDRAILPAASYSNQGKAKEAKLAVSRLQSQWAVFFAATKDGFPGDKQWTMLLDKVDDRMAEISTASEKGDWAEVHEILEGVRNTFEDYRSQRHIPYYLDGLSRYRRVLEQTTTVLTNKTASDLTDADIHFVASMLPDLKVAWASVQSAHLDAELFELDAEKIAEIRSSMDAVRTNIEKLEMVVAGGSRDQIFGALRLLKPSLKKAFLLFGRF